MFFFFNLNHLTFYFIWWKVIFVLKPVANEPIRKHQKTSFWEPQKKEKKKSMNFIIYESEIN